MRKLATAAVALLLAAAPVAAVEEGRPAATPAAAEESAAGAPAGVAERPVEFGIQTPQEKATFEELVAIWQAAERLGFRSAWVYDHFLPIIGDEDDAVLEGWTLLAALATKTERLRIGVLVTGNTYRNPALLAKMAATVDHVSGGRLDFGIGAGWFEREHVAYDFPFYTAKERAERMGEALEVITRLWKEDRASFDGRYYKLVDAPFVPKPVQRPHPPIVIGGQGKQWIMPLVARYADEWNVPMRMTPADVKERVALLREECARVGREPCNLEVSAFLALVSITDVPMVGPLTRLGARVLYGDVAHSVLSGSAQRVAARIQEFVDAGATRVIVNLRPPFDEKLLERFASDVMTRVRARHP
jgi:F420-dependent oxidoreductase-like protein